jgi:hypothetical protein
MPSKRPGSGRSRAGMTTELARIARGMASRSDQRPVCTMSIDSFGRFSVKDDGELTKGGRGATHVARPSSVVASPRFRARVNRIGEHAWGVCRG